MSVEVLTTVSPITNQPVLTRNGLSDSDAALLPAVATQAFNRYRLTSLSQRQDVVRKALQLIGAKQDVLARELTEQMGRPIAYAAKEITTAVARGEYLLKISDEALQDTQGEPEEGFRRYIKKVPVGPILILFTWNVCILSDLSSHHLVICWRELMPNTTLPVSLPHLGQFIDTSSSRREYGYTEAFAPDAYRCGAHP